MDETDAKQTADIVQPDRKAKVAGKPLWAAGKFDRAFQCDGSNYIDLGDIGNFERTEAFSYGAWIKPQGAGNGAPIARMDDRGGHRGYDIYVIRGQVAMHLINSWPGNALKVTTTSKLKPDTWQHVLITYDGSSKAAGVTVYFDGKPQKVVVNTDNLSATARTDKPLFIGRRNPGSPFKGLVDDVRVYGRELAEAEVATLAGQDPIGPLLAIPAEQRTEEQTTALRNYYLHAIDQTYQSLEKELTAAKAEIAAAQKPISTVMVMQDVGKPRMTYVLERGHYASPDKEQPVEPGVLSFLPQPPEDAPPNRLGLAQWIVDPQHPLTARVAVNRYWYYFFGQGLVRSVADFGSQGERPSHPALLDWLAVDFVESGWDVKRMIKQMVLSQTYRQSSRISPQLLESDPENRLLARGPRFRLQGEMIRDNALAASGLLVPEIGGPSVKPYQPPGLWNEVALSGNVRFVQDKGDKLYRRSMYTYWKRSAPAPSMTIFDAPTREKCTIARARTNTPLQALVTLNDPQFLEAARALASRAMREGGSTVEDQIAYAYRLATGVRPPEKIVALLKLTFEEERSVFAAEAERAKKLLAIGESPREESIDPATHAAMSIVASIILNLDETITRG